jgi:hypothetical protein
MKTFDCNGDPRLLPSRSLECRRNFVRASQKEPFTVADKTFNPLARCLRIPFPHFGKFEILSAERPEPINPRNIRSGYVH